MSNAAPKIEIKDLSVSYGAATVLRNVSMDIQHHEILSIIGPANSGKSSLLLAINHMLDRIPGASVTGSILLDGKNFGAGDDIEELRRRIGMVYAMPIPLPMTIRENILFGPRLKRKVSRSEGDAIIEKTLRAAYLWEEVKDRLNTSAQNLSGGQQQRLCLARTLAVEPEIIMYDEPCSGLDPISTARVEEAMKELKSVHTQILVTNNTKQAARVGDRTAFLLMGELVEIDTTARIFTMPSDERTEQYVTGKFG
jgi:phosphate transport system ATP-binding protein